MTKEERYAIQKQIEDLKAQLRESDETQFVEEMHAAEKKYLGRFFVYEDKLIHPISVLTPECPYQIWCIVIDIHSFSCKRDLHKTYIDPADKYAYLFDYKPIYIRRYSYELFDNGKMKEMPVEDFEILASNAFKRIWEDIHDTLPLPIPTFKNN